MNVCQRTRKDSDEGLIQICTKTNERTTFKISKSESKIKLRINGRCIAARRTYGARN